MELFPCPTPTRLIANTPPTPYREIKDGTPEWTLEPKSFDYIHAWLLGSVSDWDALYHQVLRARRPGEWFESYEGFAGAA